METTRQNKISRLIQKDLGTMFQKDSRDHYNGAMITVTKVSVTKDLSIAKVFVSLFAVADKDAMMDRIRAQAKETRRKLGSMIHNQIRVIPELHFFLDDSLDYIENIDHLLHQ
jgi:ribosome-binding factor A